MQSVQFNLPVKSPDVIVIGIEETAPEAGTVMAQSPALQGVLNGYIIVAVKFASDDSLLDFEIAVRSSANADLSVLLVSGAETPGLIAIWMQAANTNYVQVRAKGAGTSAKLYQAALNIWRY